MADSVFLGNQGVSVDAAGALLGDGQIGDPLLVNVDGTTIEVNGSNQLALVTGAGQSRTPSATTSTIVIGAVVGTTQTATITLKNPAGDTITGVRLVVMLFFSSDANASPANFPGDFAAITEGSGIVFQDEDRTLDPTYAGAVFYGRSNTSGLVSFTLDNAGAGDIFDRRLSAVFVDGAVTSAAFAIPTA